MRRARGLRELLKFSLIVVAGIPVLMMYPSAPSRADPGVDRRGVLVVVADGA